MFSSLPPPRLKFQNESSSTCTHSVWTSINSPFNNTCVYIERRAAFPFTNKAKSDQSRPRGEMIMIFVSVGVLINGEEIMKRDSREIVCSRRVTIKIENWVDPEARWKVTSVRVSSTYPRYPCFGLKPIFFSFSFRALQLGDLSKLYGKWMCYVLCTREIARFGGENCGLWKFILFSKGWWRIVFQLFGCILAAREGSWLVKYLERWIFENFEHDDLNKYSCLLYASIYRWVRLWFVDFCVV